MDHELLEHCHFFTVKLLLQWIHKCHILFLTLLISSYYQGMPLNFAFKSYVYFLFSRTIGDNESLPIYDHIGITKSPITEWHGYDDLMTLLWLSCLVMKKQIGYYTEPFKDGLKVVSEESIQCLEWSSLKRWLVSGNHPFKMTLPILSVRLDKYPVTCLSTTSK